MEVKVNLKTYDITQELFSSVVYPGDTAPEYKRVLSIEKGDVCNLTELSMCAHNGTHLDAPAHFIKGGDTIDQISLDRVIGMARVVFFDGVIGREDAEDLLEPDDSFLLIGGNATVSLPAAQVFSKAGLRLIGNESQTFGGQGEQPEVHRELLGAGVLLLEGIRLAGVPAGNYLLVAAPINLGGSDGAPVRAILVEV